MAMSPDATERPNRIESFAQHVEKAPPTSTPPPPPPPPSPPPPPPAAATIFRTAAGSAAISTSAAPPRTRGLQPFFCTTPTVGVTSRCSTSWRMGTKTARRPKSKAATWRGQRGGGRWEAGWGGTNAWMSVSGVRGAGSMRMVRYLVLKYVQQAPVTPPLCRR